ncbi:unnamed protein product [Prunus armeniaca]
MKGDLRDGYQDCTPVVEHMSMTDHMLLTKIVADRMFSQYLVIVLDATQHERTMQRVVPKTIMIS